MQLDGLVRRMAGDYFEARCAGIEPKGLNPPGVEVMRETGIDILKRSLRLEGSAR